MISATAVCVVRYLAPLLFLASIILSTVSLVAPVTGFHASVSLIAIHPGQNIDGHVISDATSLAMKSALEGRKVMRRAALARALQSVADGPSVVIGPLGSCSRQQNSQDMKCTSASWAPSYDYSMLPTNAPLSALPSSVPATTPAFFLAGLIISALFFLTSFLLSLPDILPKCPAPLLRLNQNPAIARAIASLGLIGLVVQLLSTLVWCISFSRDVDEFNTRISESGGQPALMASLASGFTLMWIAIGFQAPLLVCQLARINSVQAGGSK